VERARVGANVQRAVTAVLARVEHSLVAYRMVLPGQRVLVAVSGGPDSVGLLGVMARLREKLKIGLMAGHVNHRLRGAESDADERCARTAAAQLGVEFVSCALPGGLALRGNLEERARELRYEALRSMARESACERVATGHTRDDQAETVLLRLLRGSGPAGLAGIQPVRGDGIIRPLLACARAEIEHVARALDLRYRLDSTNADTRFTRTRLRQEILPLLRRLNPKIATNLAHVGELCRAEAEVVKAWAHAQLESIVQNGALDVDRLAGVPPGLQGHLLRRWLVSAGVIERGLGAQQVNLVLRLARGRAPSGTVVLRQGQTVRRRYRWLTVGAREQTTLAYEPHTLLPGASLEIPGGWHISASAPVVAETTPTFPADLWTALCDADEIEGPLLVRAPRVGERLAPLGLAGTRKLSDVLTDRKVPAPERHVHPVVVHGDAIVWVPGVVRSQTLRLSAATARVVSLRAWRSGEGDR